MKARPDHRKRFEAREQQPDGAWTVAAAEDDLEAVLEHVAESRAKGLAAYAATTDFQQLTRSGRGLRATEQPLPAAISCASGLLIMAGLFSLPASDQTATLLALLGLAGALLARRLGSKIP